MLEFEPQRTYAITDVKYYNGEIFVTGVSNQRFASTLHRIPYPFNAQMATCTVEIWHPVHGEFETRAPIIRQLIREVNGEPYLFAVYGCTPLVRFPLASLKDGAHVRGDMIGELGYGSNPLDMLTFTDPFDQKEYLLVTIDTRSASRIAVADLEAAQPEPTGGPIDFGPGGLGRTQRDLPIRAEHTAILNPKWAVVDLAASEDSVSIGYQHAGGAVLLRAQRWHVGNELARWSGSIPLSRASQARYRPWWADVARSR